MTVYFAYERALVFINRRVFLRKKSACTVAPRAERAAFSGGIGVLNIVGVKNNFVGVLTKGVDK